MPLNKETKPNQTKMSCYNFVCGGARGVIVILAGNGHSDTSANPGWEWLHFT